MDSAVRGAYSGPKHNLAATGGQPNRIPVLKKTKTLGIVGIDFGIGLGQRHREVV